MANHRPPLGLVELGFSTTLRGPIRVDKQTCEADGLTFEIVYRDFHLGRDVSTETKPNAAVS